MFLLLKIKPLKSLNIKGREVNLPVVPPLLENCYSPTLPVTPGRGSAYCPSADRLKDVFLRTSVRDASSRGIPSLILPPGYSFLSLPFMGF